MLTKHTQNVTDMSRIPLYVYSIDLHMSWMYISPHLHNITLLRGTIPSAWESRFGCLTRQAGVSATGLCAYSSFHGALHWRKRKGKTKQNCSRPGSGWFGAGRGNLETAAHRHGVGARLLKTKATWLTVKWEKGSCFPSDSDKSCSGYLKHFNNMNFMY